MLFRGEEINADFRKILGHNIKHGGLGIPDHRLSAESAYNTSKAASGELVYSLLGGSALNYVGHRACVHKASQTARRIKMSVELAEIFKRQEQAGGQEKTRLHRETRNAHGLALYPTALTAQSCLRRNSGIILASDMG